MSRSILLIFTVVSSCLLAGASRLQAQTDHFRTHVAPVLQRRCLSCHNDSQHKGDLSLQTAAGLMKEGYVKAGDSAASHLVDVITPKDGKAQMPKKADPLSAEEIKAISKWIDDGARWPDEFVLEEPKVTDFDWWSYNPISQPDVPPVGDRDARWVRTPIDAFILQKLNEKGLIHSDEADRRTLIRRLTYDLIGLPPTPEEVAAFVADDDPRAWDRLVDRLLESKHYGERWARHWLDVVKYADTCGYDKDKLRPNAWPYRDYVIRSFNDDEPYARFVQEQIAGDVLFPGKADGILALGFIAAGPWDFIGHVEVPESKIDGKVARNLDRDDMVSNTLNTFCSVTVQCARCHNHKFDPITQEDYYGLQSIFAAVDRADRSYDLDANVEKQRHELNLQLAEKQADLHVVTKEIVDDGGPRFLELNGLITSLRKKVAVKKPPEFGYHSAISDKADTQKWVQVELAQPTDIERIVLRPCHDEFNDIGAGFGFPKRFKIEIATGDDWTTISDQTKTDFHNPQLSPFEVKDIAAKTRRIRVTATQLALRSNDYILALAELEVFDTSGKNVALNATVQSLDSIEAPVRWGKTNLTDGMWPKAADQKLAAQLAEVTREQAGILARIQTPNRIKRRDAVNKAIKQLEDKLAALPQGQMVYAAATKFKPQANFKPTNGELRPVHVLHRGNIQQPREAAVPCVLPLKNEVDGRLNPELEESQRRAELAQWLANKDNPLVWRSIVNRVWLYHFDQGLVATPNDFGRMGARPTHPELLDWLAVQFRDNGQSLKQLHRLIVTSSVYRQSSKRSSANAAIDGSNQFLWRMKRRRLEAEEIRDSILSVSGAMNPEMGGPGFYLFALEKTDHSPHYEYYKFDPTDPKSHRRSIYRFIVRSQPDPWMTTLDCADSSQSTPKRDETLTSLQALSLLNNRFNLVMAERFAERLKKAEKDPSKQIDRAVLLIAQRAPDAAERDELEAYAKTHGLPNLCRILFNLSEFVYLD